MACNSCLTMDHLTSPSIGKIWIGQYCRSDSFAGGTTEALKLLKVFVSRKLAHYPDKHGNIRKSMAPAASRPTCTSATSARSPSRCAVQESGCTAPRKRHSSIK